jgi:2-polyprenyl-3-methyl-5-hydroxy-6-metoxy-1,4-benzoquinol methylase
MTKNDHVQALQVRKDIGQVKPLIWDTETTVRFWNHYSLRPDLYFTNRYGSRLLDYIAQLLPADGNIIDYGCGTGGLTGLLLDRGFLVAAADISSVAVNEVSQRFANRDHFLGASHVEDLLQSRKKFAAAFLIEMIEHANDLSLSVVFDNIRNLLLPRGLLVITTPNDENLQDESVYCPCCDQTFHRWQHVRSWSTSTLRLFLLQQGFEPVLFLTTDLSLTPLDGRLRFFVKRLVGTFLKRKLPHLVAVARLLESAPKSDWLRAEICQ